VLLPKESGYRSKMRSRSLHDEKWKTVLFSDEKRWNLDGPGGSSYYWHSFRKEVNILSKRQMSGWSVMTWSYFVIMKPVKVTNELASRSHDRMDWPPRSLDCNPIEKLCGIIPHNVYDSWRQFENREQLETQLLISCNAISN